MLSDFLSFITPFSNVYGVWEFLLRAKTRYQMPFLKKDCRLTLWDGFHSEDTPEVLK